MSKILLRLSMFYRQLFVLWRAFWHKSTPLYLKALMIGIIIYLISPIDLIPDFLLLFGLVDDVIIVAFAVNWIIKRLPPEIFGQTNNAGSQADFSQSNFDEQAEGATIDGTSRRL